MGIHQMRKLLTVTTGIALAIVSSSVIAATDWSYNLSTQCPPDNSSVGTHSSVCTVSNPSLTLSGWSTATGTISNPTAGTTFAAANIYDWGISSGLGIVAKNENSGSTGPHSADNRNGTDAFLLSFTNAVDLESIKIGWNGSDNTGTYDPGTSTNGLLESSDISILAYTGKVPPSPSMSDASLATLTSSGWTLVGNYGQVGKLTDNTAIISSSITSSWWLISAYNASYGNNPASSSGYALTTGNDYFKLLSVAGNNPPNNKTPEPGSMVLLGAGLLGMLVLRRRRPTEV